MLCKIAFNFTECYQKTIFLRMAQLNSFQGHQELERKHNIQQQLAGASASPTGRSSVRTGLRGHGPRETNGSRVAPGRAKHRPEKDASGMLCYRHVEPCRYTLHGSLLYTVHVHEISIRMHSQEHCV